MTAARARSYEAPRGALAAALLGGLVMAGAGAQGDAGAPKKGHAVDAPAGAADLAGADAPRGRLLLAHYHCGTCHTIPGVADARGNVAITLEGFGRRSYIAGRVANEPPLLAQWIRRPASLVPETTMPDMGASPRDARDMAAYLGQLR